MVVNRNVGRHLPKVLCVKNCHWLKVPYTSWYSILINDSFTLLIYVNDQNPHRIKHKPIYKNVHQTTIHTATASIKLVYQNVHQTTKHTVTASIKLVYQNVPPNNQRPATANTKPTYHDIHSLSRHLFVSWGFAI